MSGNSVGSIWVDLKARTDALEAGLDKAGKEVERLQKRAASSSRQAAQQVQGLGDSIKRQGESIKFGAGQATQGLLQLTDSAGIAGRAASGLTASLQGLFQGGLVGAGIAAVTAGFALITEHARKAEEERAKIEARELERRKQLAERQATEAEGVHTRLLDGKRQREEAAFREDVERLEREAKARGGFYDARLALELRASQERQRAIREQTGTELGAIAELEAEVSKASGKERQELERTLGVRRQNLQLLRQEADAERRKPQASRDASGGRQRAQELAELRKAQDAVAAGVAAEAKAHSDAKVELRHKVSAAAELASLTEEERKYADLVAAARAAEALGMADVAAKARELVEYEKQRAAYSQAQAEYARKVQQRATADAALAKREQLANARTDAQKEAVRLEQEYAQLVASGASHAQAVNTLLAEAAQRARERKDVQNETVRSLEQELEVATAKTDAARLEVERAQELNKVREAGGERAVKLQQELNALKDEQASKDKAAARTAREASGELGVALGAGKYKVRADGTVDKGLASSRQARRNANRARKYDRQQRARESAGRSIHDGQFQGLGGIRSGRRTDQAGAFSSWYGGAGDMDQGGGGGQMRGGPRGPGRLPGEGLPGGPAGPGRPANLPPVVTGQAGEGAKGTMEGRGVAGGLDPATGKAMAEAGTAAAGSAEEAAKSLEEAKGAAEKTAEALGKGAESAAGAAKASEAQQKASEDQQGALEKLLQAIEGKGGAVNEAMAAATRKLLDVAKEQERQRQALETLQKSLSGSG